LLALASLNHACQDQVLTFPQRSPPSHDSGLRWLEINT